MDEKKNQNIQNEDVNTEKLPVLEPSKEVEVKKSEETVEKPVVDETLSKKEEVKVEEPKKEVPTDLEKKKVEEQKKLKENSPKLILILVALFLIVASFAAYYAFSSSPKRILVSSISTLNKKLNNLSNDMNETKTVIGNDFTETGTFRFNVSSDILTQYQQLGLYPEVMNVIKNLGKTDFNYTYKQDLTKKQMYFQLNPELDGKEVTNVTYYNNNSKQYVLMKELAKNYLQLEDLDIFDELNNKTKLDDYNYIIDVIKDSLYKNVKSDYFKVSNVKIKVDDKEKDVKKVTLALNNKRANELFKAIIKDLKKDKKANQIMTKIVPDFKNYEVEDANENTDDSKLNITSYVTKFSHEPLKYAITVTDGYTKKESGLAYTSGKTNELEFITDEKVIATLEITGNWEQFEMNLKDEKSKSLGKLKVTNQQKKSTAKLTVDVDKTLMLGCDFSTNKNVVKANEQMKSNSKASCQLIGMNGENYATFEMTGTNEVKKGVSIKEDVTDSREMTSEDTESLNTLLQKIILTYMQ